MDAGVCSPWAEVGDVCAPCNSYDFLDADLADWLEVASDMLFDLTKRRWPGECTQLIRPCHRSLCGCAERGRCGCRRLSQFDLGPGAQVVAIDAVIVDGVVVNPARYRLDEGRWLVYLPESDSAEVQGWPRHQRLDLPTTAEDTWSIAYTFGAAPPLGGLKAAAELGCQLMLSCHPDPQVAARCRLPKAITNVSRQGLTIAKANPAALYPGGQTGVPSVDLWVATVNRGSAIRPANVFVPGQAATRRIMA